MDGASVTVLVDDDTPVRLSDDDILELKAAQAEIRAGEYVTVDELFTLLRKKAPK